MTGAAGGGVPAMPRRRGPTPKQRIFFYSPQEFEEFIYEWVRALEVGYVDVRVHGGAGDHGVDVAAFLTQHRLNGDWHAYQCKHYGKPLALSAALPEMLKAVAAVVEGHYQLPSRYVFVAPAVSPNLVRDMDTPDRLKREFLDWIASANKAFSALPEPVRRGVAELAGRTHFSMFETANLDTILDQHRTTRYVALRFDEPLPDRPDVPLPPREHEPGEFRYIQQLLEVYAERFGKAASTLVAVQGHAKASEHLRRQREAFFSAEWLRMYARDAVPEGHFEALQKDMYDGVVEVADQIFELAWERVQAVLLESQRVQLGSAPLVSVVKPLDRRGVCHQLANDDRLTWYQGD